MVNLGSSQSTKEHARISGNVVITTIDMSGVVIDVSISGNPVRVSGQTVIAKISGDAVTVSGNWVDVSGATIFAKISGETVSIAGGVSVSGNAVTISGNWVTVSGSTVISLISGQTISIDGGVNVSGATVIALISGQTISIDGGVNVSGATVISKISGESVFVYISGGISSMSGAWVDVSGATVKSSRITTPISVWTSGAGAIATTLSNTGTNYFEYAEYNATSGVVTSSEFKLTHVMANGRSVNVLSLNMATDTVHDLLFTPDNPMVLLSGDQVTVVYSNPDNRNWNLRIVGGN